MLESLRTFVHWADALLHVDCTREKCDAVYTVVDHRLGEEKQQAEQAKESRKESSKFFQDLIVSTMPAIIEVLTKPKPSPTIRFEPERDDPDMHDPAEGSVHIGRRPVVVDRQDQREPAYQPAAPDPNPPEIRPEEVQLMNKIDELVRTVPSSLAQLSQRMNVIEKRLFDLEAFSGKPSNLQNPSA